jgi:hypothetical protein
MSPSSRFVGASPPREVGVKCIIMNFFNWGDPHPLAIERSNRKHDSDRLTAKKFNGFTGG